MRNITSTFSHVYGLPGQAASGVSKIVKTTVNPENDELFVLTEKCDGSEEVEVEVLRALRKGSDRVLQSISSLSLPRNTFFPTPRDEPECISFRYLAEDRALCVITSGGDIALFKLEGDDFEAGNYEDSFVQGYTVGTIESGIKAASWSPDEEQVILITGDDQLVVMSREFEPMYEAPLRTEDFGEDAQINVGWGSKQTQFHGSLGKTAAQITATRLPIGSPDDSELPTISWRGDGSYFCINSSDAYSGSSSRPGEKRRQMRIYARSPIALSATSEPIFGMEGPMSWRPMGNLIAVVQGFGWEGGAEGEGEDRGRKDVIFLERNGLQHGDFRLREDENYRGRESEIERGSTGWKVKELAYASDSEVLAVWIRKDEEDVVQLWTMNNYHYYLKQELHPSATSRITPARFTSVTWHSEKALTLYLTGEDFASERQFEWEAVASRLAMPNDTGSVAVIDGKKLLLTPFRSQNVPPPMSAYHIDLPSVPVHISFSPIDDDLGILLNNGKYLVYKLNTRILTAGARGGGAISRPIQSGQGVLKSDSTTEWRQVVLDGEGCVYGLGGSKHGEDITATSTGTFILSSSGGRLICDASGKARTMSEKGDIAVCSDLAPLEVIPFPHFCFDMVAAPEFGLLFGRESSGRLWMQLDEHKIQEKKETFSDNGSSDSGNANEVHEVTTNATSITVSSTYLIWTTTTHESKYASLDILRSIAAGNAVPESERTWETRRVERGSKIVTVIPSAMSLVLQMPRGNLESINPRALVLEVVKRDILAKRYRSAFLHCRRHRIDLNILCDVDPIVFRDDMASFVAQVKEVDYLNLVVSGLRNDDVTQTMYPRLRLARSSAASGRNKVNDICDLIRSELEKKDMIKYVDTILTTHVCKDPPDLESGLRVLLRLKSTNPGIVEDAIKYIIFLTNVNQLFDVALGMYDFQLVLMIAQYSQKDPKEYLPFLRELRELDKNYQRYRIDDHLQRWESALKHLHAGERFDEALEYIDQHELYQPAINLYQARPEELKAIYILYGENLLEKRLDYEAATAFVLGERLDRAMVAYEQAHAWRELFALAVSERTEKEALLEICERVSEYLATHSRHIEAAQIHLDYGKNVEEAVHVLCRGAAFAEATRIIALHGKSELIETTLYPGLDDAHEQFVDVFDEMEGQLDKEMNRIIELRRKVDDDPESFFMIESEPALENVDVMTNATTAVTGFTRYTAAKSAMTGTSKMSSSTRKRSRRRAAGHKGTIEEFDYLLGSLGRLVTRISEKSDEVSSVLPHLLLTSPAHRELGQELQGKVQAFREKVLLSIDKAWKHKEEVDGVRHRLIGEEEKTREIWLAAQRHAMGAQSESVQVEPEHAPAPAISKPTLASWSGKSRFL